MLHQALRCLRRCCRFSRALLAVHSGQRLVAAFSFVDVEAVVLDLLFLELRFFGFAQQVYLSPPVKNGVQNVHGDGP